MKLYVDLFKVNFPNGITIAVINWGNVQQKATLILTIMSIVSTALVIRKHLKDKKQND